MTLLRRLAYATLTLAFAQVVFGAIVRISGSGMGCGDHWPKCNGQWFPPQDSIDRIIEFTHRCIAAGLTVALLGLVVVAFGRRSIAGVGGPGGVLRPATVAAGLVLLAAGFGGATVKMGLNPYLIVTHLAIAMSLLAVLVVTVVRSGGFGIDNFDAETDTSRKTYRAAMAATVLAFLV